MQYALFTCACQPVPDNVPRSTSAPPWGNIMLKHTVRALALLLVGLGLSTWVQLPASAIVDRDAATSRPRPRHRTSSTTQAREIRTASTRTTTASLVSPTHARASAAATPAARTRAPTTSRTRDRASTARPATSSASSTATPSRSTPRRRHSVCADARHQHPERGRCGAGEATDNLRRMAPVRSTVHLVSDPPKQPRTDTDASCATSSDRAATTISRSARPGTATRSATCSAASRSPGTASTYAA